MAAQMLVENKNLSENIVLLHDEELSNELRKARKKAKLSEKQLYPFLAAAQQEKSRPHSEQIGIDNLFVRICENGSKHWLNPMTFLRPLDIALMNFNGPRSSLKPLIDILTELAGQELSPADFLRFVVLPRMKNDNNWRQWERNHFDALNLIKDHLVKMKNKGPFKSKNGSNLIVNLILVRYIGRPICSFSAEILSSNQMNEYLKKWEKLSLTDRKFQFYFRQNVLHYLYDMAKKTDFLKLYEIVDNTAELESKYLDFISTNPKEEIKENFVVNTNLYPPLFRKGLQIRKNKGYSNYAVTVELIHYLKIPRLLCSILSNQYSRCGFLFKQLIGILKNHMKPGSLMLAARFLEMVSGQDSLFIRTAVQLNYYFSWHLLKLLNAESPEKQEEMLQTIENEGALEGYPGSAEIFSFEEKENKGFYSIEQLSLWFGFKKKCDLLSYIEKIYGKKKAEEIHKSPANILNKNNCELYISLAKRIRPNYGSIIEKALEDFSAGKDRNWGSEQVHMFSEIPLFFKLLEKLIGLSPLCHNDDIIKRFNKYQRVSTHSLPDIRKNFSFPKSSPVSNSPIVEKECRDKVNISVLQKVMEWLNDENTVDLNSAYRILGEKVREIQITVHKMREKANEEQDLNKKNKILNSVQKMEKKKTKYESVFQELEQLDDSEKLYFFLYILSEYKMKDEIFEIVFKILLERYRAIDELSSQLEFLKMEIDPDDISLEQSDMMITVLENLKYCAVHDKAFIKINEKIQKAEGRNRWVRRADMLSQFSVLRDQHYDEYAIDAAMSHITGLNKIRALREQWMDLIDRKQNKKKSFEHYSLFLSKSFLDSYYGNMGQICLSNYPEAVLHPKYFNVRLMNRDDKKIEGMMIVKLSTSKLPGTEKPFWFAYGFNPRNSFLHKLSKTKKLYLYLQYRKLLETLAKKSGLPVFVPTYSGILSNRSDFQDYINYCEVKFGSPELMHVEGAGLGVKQYYSYDKFSNGMLIINPANPKTFYGKKIAKWIEREVFGLKAQ